MLFLAFVPLGPVDYSSKLSGVFILLGTFQVMTANTISMLISNIYVLSIALVDSAMPVLIKLYETIISFPYDQINYWYILLGLLIVSYFKEKFRTINNELNKLRKIMSNSREKDKTDNKSNSAEQINILNQRAIDILELLTEISSAAESFKNTHVRTKKIRRANTDVVSIDTTVLNAKSSKDEDQLMRLRKDQTLQENNADEIMSDQNISQVDLARAYIESHDKEDAINLIKKIIETGTEEEKHEAKLLYMQIK